MGTQKLTVKVVCELDVGEAEKVKQIANLLAEAQQLIESLSINVNVFEG